MLRYLKGAALAISVIVALVIGWRFVVALALIVGTEYLRREWERRQAAARCRRGLHPKGKDLLLVYSNSPHWQRYVEEHWLPKWGDRAAVLNWSEKQASRKSRRPEAPLFRAFAGDREFNPLGIVVPPSGPVQVVRFWRAFRDFKHGKEQSLQQAEADSNRSSPECDVAHNKRLQPAAASAIMSRRSLPRRSHRRRRG